MALPPPDFSSPSYHQSPRGGGSGGPPSSHYPNSTYPHSPYPSSRPSVSFAPHPTYIPPQQGGGHYGNSGPGPGPPHGYGQGGYSSGHEAPPPVAPIPAHVQHPSYPTHAQSYYSGNGAANSNSGSSRGNPSNNYGYPDPYASSYNSSRSYDKGRSTKRNSRYTEPKRPIPVVANMAIPRHKLKRIRTTTIIPTTKTTIRTTTCIPRMKKNTNKTFLDVQPQDALEIPRGNLSTIKTIMVTRILPNTDMDIHPPAASCTRPRHRECNDFSGDNGLTVDAKSHQYLCHGRRRPGSWLDCLFLVSMEHGKESAKQGNANHGLNGSQNQDDGMVMPGNAKLNLPANGMYGQMNNGVAGPMNNGMTGGMTGGMANAMPNGFPIYVKRNDGPGTRKRHVARTLAISSRSIAIH